jgi:hypothetical protein
MDTNEILKLIENKNYASLTSYVDDLFRRWGEGESLQSFDALWNISQAVLESDDRSPEGKRLLLDVVKSALERKATGEVKNYELLTRQADFLPLLLRQDVFSEEPTFREMRCSLLTSFMAKINEIRDSGYVPAQVFSSVPPIIMEGVKPGDIPMGGTMNPTTIKNPELRKKYEERIQENQRNIDANQEVLVANSLYDRYEPDLKDFFASLYLGDPENVSELRECLHHGKFSEEFTDDVLERIKEGHVANP